MQLAVYLLLINAVTFVAYWLDKRAARNRQWRIPEGSLLLLGFLGGWPLGLVAMQTLRHKTRKTSFQAKFWLLVFAQITLLIWQPDPLKMLLTRAFG